MNSIMFSSVISTTFEYIPSLSVPVQDWKTRFIVLLFFSSHKRSWQWGWEMTWRIENYALPADGDAMDICVKDELETGMKHIVLFLGVIRLLLLHEETRRDLLTSYD
jgi:hypothetical protein